ncbi:MAG: nitric oxide reductase transcriptional regulator NorR [Halioglobus sp.]|nr:nitric oxide reductase transcriptional regulator NorR [Halioglobus sp.]
MIAVSPLAVLYDIAVDLAASLSTEERFERLLSATRRVIPCGAATILKLEDGSLRPLAAMGLRREAMGRRFQVNAHPRFARILECPGITRFDVDSTLPDPYDGLLLSVEGGLPVHACMGARLIVQDKVWGAITFDDLEPNAFDETADELVEAFSAFAAAAASAADYIAVLEHSASREHELNQNLIDQILSHSSHDMVGQSDVMQSVRKEIDLVAASDLAVLITGETGVGKELVARAVHTHSKRAAHPIVYLNCATLPENLAESELFGHKKGAFTGATKDYRGKFELADKGTLFLDEIGELPVGLQAKLLRVLQSGEVQSLGSEVMHYVDVRVVAATNRDLKTEVLEGRFRQDLFHRLSVFPIQLPPLRERDGDIPLLAGHFIEALSVQFGLRGVTLSTEALRILESYAWPGNVRELEHVINRALLRISARKAQTPAIIQASDLDNLVSDHAATRMGLSDSASSGELRPLADLLNNFQVQLIRERLDLFDNNWSRTAASLGVNRGNLHRLARRLGMK